MSDRVLDFKSYFTSISESVEKTYSLDQISDALDAVEDEIQEYFNVIGTPDVKLEYSQSGDNVEVYPGDVSDEPTDYSYRYDSSLSQEVIKNLDSSDDGKKPRFTEDVIEEAIDKISDNSDYYIRGIDVGSVGFNIDAEYHGDDEIRVTGEVDDSASDDIVVDSFDFDEWKSDVMQEIVRSISKKIYLNQ